MKVHRNDPVRAPEEIKGAARAGKPPSRDRTTAADRLEVSATARELSAAREAALGAPEVRVELVEGARRRIAEGSYEPDVRMIAGQVLEDLGVFGPS